MLAWHVRQLLVLACLAAQWRGGTGAAAVWECAVCRWAEHVGADTAGRLRARGTFVNYAPPRAPSGSNGAARIPSAPGAGVGAGVSLGVGRQQGPTARGYARIVSGPPATGHAGHTVGLGLPQFDSRNQKPSKTADPPPPQLDAVQAAHRDGWALLLKDYTLPQLTSICHLL